MESTRMIMLAGGLCAVILLVMAGREAKRAPAMFATACLLAGALAIGAALDERIMTTSTKVALICVPIIIALTIILIATARHRTVPALYEAEGTDMEAIRRACRAQEDALRVIEEMNRRRDEMPILERIRDAFVTTPEETRVVAAVRNKVLTDEHLHRIVPVWHEGRVREIASMRGDGAIIAEMHSRLQPLEEVEQAERTVHDLALDALRAIDRAISQIDSAKSYEMMDAVTSNKGISVVSSMSTSSARNCVERAREAVVRLSEGTRVAIDGKMIAPDDTFDLILDMAMDSAFDFMSIFNLGKLSKAKERCQEVRAKVAAVEVDLSQKFKDAEKAASAVRDEIDAWLKPHRYSAREELPPLARTHLKELN